MPFVSRGRILNIRRGASRMLNGPLLDRRRTVQLDKLNQGAMIKVFNKTTGEFIGRISEADLKFLAEQLEEESLDDSDYYIRAETLAQFADQNAPAHLMDVLRGGLRSDPAIEIRWEHEKKTGQHK